MGGVITRGPPDSHKSAGCRAGAWSGELRRHRALGRAPANVPADGLYGGHVADHERGPGAPVRWAGRRGAAGAGGRVVTLAHVDVHRRTPFDDGRYERLQGVARFAVDPDAPENAGITDLRLAPRDAGGAVRFEADFCVLRPSDPGGASGRLLVQVANRGRHSSVPFSVLTAPPSAEVTERIDPGDGFLLRRGWIVAWCG